MHQTCLGLKQPEIGMDWYTTHTHTHSFTNISWTFCLWKLLISGDLFKAGPVLHSLCSVSLYVFGWTKSSVFLAIQELYSLLYFVFGCRDHDECVSVLAGLRLWHSQQLQGGLQGYILNPVFKDNLRIALLGG